MKGLVGKKTIIRWNYTKQYDVCEIAMSIAFARTGKTSQFYLPYAFSLFSIEILYFTKSEVYFRL